MILDIILLIILLIAIGGFTAGWRSGVALPASPVGIALVVIIVLLLLGLIGPHYLWGPAYAPPPVQ